MRNTRNLLLKVVMVVCAVAVCMTAYYGVRMFELQNGIKILDKIQVLLWSIVFFASVATIRKERRTKKVVNNAQLEMTPGNILFLLGVFLDIVKRYGE